MAVNDRAGTESSWLTWRRHALAGAFFAIWTLIATFPHVLHLGDWVDDWGDPLLNTWALAWNAHQVLRDPLHLYDANIFHPHPYTLAFADSLVGLAIFSAPVQWLSGNPIFTYNLMLLATFFASGFTAYLLAERLTGERGYGLIAGGIYAFGFHRIGDITHIQIMAVHWTPLVLLSVDLFWERGRRRYLALSALAFVLQMLSSFYHGLFLIPLILVQVIWLARTRPERLSWRMAPPIVLTLVAIGAVLWPFIQPYLVLRDSLGLGRSLDDATGGAAVPLSYLIVPRGSVLYGGTALPDLLPPTEQTLFPGILCLVVAAIGLLRGSLRTRYFAAIIALTGLVLSFGPGLRLFPGESVLIPLPYYLLYELVPGFGAIRVVGRLGFHTMLGLGMLASFGVAAIARGRSPRASLAISLALTLLVSAEYLSAPLHLHPIEPPDQTPPVYRWLASQPDQSPIMELPTIENRWFDQPEELARQGRYQYLSTYHWRKTPVGYSGFYPANFWELIRLMRGFPTPEGIGWLQCGGVREVVLHGDEYGPERWPGVLKQVALYRELTPAATFGSTHVYDLSAPESGTLTPPLVALAPAGGKGTFAFLAWPNAGPARSVAAERIEVSWRWTMADGDREETQSLTGPSCLSTGWTIVPTPALTSAPRTARVEVQAPSAGWHVQAEPAPAAAAASEHNSLLSWSLGSDVVKPGQAVLFQPTWFLTLGGGGGWSVSIAIRDDLGQAVAEQTAPFFPEHLPRSDTAVAAPVPTFHAIGLPPDTEPGRYWLDVRLNGPGGEALPIATPGGEPAPNQRLGPFRVPSVQRELPESPALVHLDGSFEPGLELRGAMLEEKGESLRVTLYWETPHVLPTDYQVFVHLVDAEGQLVAQHDGAPAQGRYPTSLWGPGELVADPHDLPRPPGGRNDLRLRVGIYTWPGLEQVGVRTTEGWSDAVEIPWSPAPVNASGP